MHTFQELRAQFEAYLNDYNFPESPQALYDACRHILQLGGKRVRPVLSLMAQDLFREIDLNGKQAALAVELFHNFTLVHDDIMDKADIRRGKPTVHTKFSMPTAILSGDVLNIYTYELLNNITHENQKKVVSLFNKTAIEVCEGQQMDMDFEEIANVPEGDYLEMITLKTSVLLACSLGIGALLGGANDEDVQHLYEFGKDVGIAFQLKDDYLDSFGDESKTGKKQGGDIMANKKTIFYCYITDIATDTQMKQIQDLQASSKGDKVEQTLALYRTMGADDYVSKLKEEYSQKAFLALDKVSVSAEKKAHLRELAEMLLVREK